MYARVLVFSTTKLCNHSNINNREKIKQRSRRSKSIMLARQTNFIVRNSDKICNINKERMATSEVNQVHK